jgi:hypothetical protein
MTDFKEGDFIISNLTNGMYKFIKRLDEKSLLVHDFRQEEVEVHDKFRLATPEEIAYEIAKIMRCG